MRAGSAPRRTRAAALCLALIASAPAYADYKSDYAAGLEAVRDGNWSQVRSKMQAALAQEATPVARMKIYGMRFEPYVPQYYIGLAAARSGDCASAVSNLEHAPTRSIVEKNSALSGAAAAALQQCRRVVDATPTPKPSPTPSPTVSPRPSPTPPPTPTPTPRPSPTPPPTPSPRPSPTPPPTPTPRPVASTAPAALTQAVDAYLAGRYNQAATIDMSQFTDNRARFHALLLRAAAKHTMSQLQGDPGGTLVNGAQTDIRAAKALFPANQPDASLYSPRFRALYQQTR